MNSFLPTLTERRSPWVTFTSAADPWVAAAEAELRARGGIVLRLDGEELHEKGYCGRHRAVAA